MIQDSGLHHFLWGEAVRNAMWLKNRTPTKALQGATPFEPSTGKMPDGDRRSGSVLRVAISWGDVWR